MADSRRRCRSGPRGLLSTPDLKTAPLTQLPIGSIVDYPIAHRIDCRHPIAHRIDYPFHAIGIADCRVFAIADPRLPIVEDRVLIPQLRYGLSSISRSRRIQATSAPSRWTAQLSSDPLSVA